ncbi:hypothetical protein M422DRAFT_34583 [Sphaerobolus stellatus SS14]|uniref:Uncharacterized protein n=1 Tax=Sphaerobolus stellatus (strain SS14) TaxID=990650 RepID=A0A0C9V1R2_SPHS4|nr:hypothetical protein M422DRAFT_34583 [Sphaerobolus stellatus SS14]
MERAANLDFAPRSIQAWPCLQIRRPALLRPAPLRAIMLPTAPLAPGGSGSDSGWQPYNPASPRYIFSNRPEGSLIRHNNHNEVVALVVVGDSRGRSIVLCERWEKSSMSFFRVRFWLWLWTLFDWTFLFFSFVSSFHFALHLHRHLHIIWRLIYIP